MAQNNEYKYNGHKWTAVRDENNKLTLKVEITKVDDLENILKRLPEKSLKFENASATELFFNGIKTARRNCMEKELEAAHKDPNIKFYKYEKINNYLNTLENAYSDIKGLASLVNKSTFKDGDVADLKGKLTKYKENFNSTLDTLINDYKSKTDAQSKNVLIELQRLQKTTSGEIDVYNKMLDENQKSPEQLKKLFAAKTSSRNLQSLGDFISHQTLNASRISERVTGILNQDEFYDRIQKNEITTAFIESSTEIDIKANVSFAIQSTSAFVKDPYPERDEKIQEAIKEMKKNTNTNTPFSYELDLTPFIDNSPDQRTLNKLICSVEGQSSVVEKDKNTALRIARDIGVITGSIVAYGLDLIVAATLASFQIATTALLLFPIKPILLLTGMKNEDIDKAISDFTKPIVDSLEKYSPLALFKTFLNNYIYNCADKNSDHQKLLWASVDNHSEMMTRLDALSPGRLSTGIVSFLTSRVTAIGDAVNKTYKNFKEFFDNAQKDKQLEHLDKQYETYLLHKMYAEFLKNNNDQTMPAADKLTLALPREDLKSEHFQAVSKVFGEIPFLFCNRLVMESLHAHPAPATAFLMLSMATGAGAILPVPLLLAKLGISHAGANAIMSIDKVLQVVPQGIASTVSGVDLAAHASLMHSAMAVAFENKLLNLMVMATMELMKEDSTLSAKFAQNSEMLITAAGIMLSIGIGCACMPELPMNLINPALTHGLPINTPINMPIAFANGLISTAKEAFVHGAQGANSLELAIMGFKIACITHESLQSTGSVFKNIPKTEWEAFTKAVNQNISNQTNTTIDDIKTAINTALQSGNFPNLLMNAKEVEKKLIAETQSYTQALQSKIANITQIGSILSSSTTNSSTNTDTVQEKIIKLMHVISMLSDPDIICPFEPKNTREGRALYNEIASLYAEIKNAPNPQQSLKIDMDSYLTAFRNKYCEDTQNVFMRFISSPFRIPYNITMLAGANLIATSRDGLKEIISNIADREPNYYLQDSRTASLNRDLAGFLNVFATGSKIMIGTMGQAMDYSIRGLLGSLVFLYSFADKDGADNMARGLQRNVGFSSTSQRLHEEAMASEHDNAKSTSYWLFKRETFIDRLMTRVNVTASTFDDPKSIGAIVSENNFAPHKAPLNTTSNSSTPNSSSTSNTSNVPVNNPRQNSPSVASSTTLPISSSSPVDYNAQINGLIDGIKNLLSLKLQNQIKGITPATLTESDYNQLVLDIKNHMLKHISSQSALYSYQKVQLSNSFENATDISAKNSVLIEIKALKEEMDKLNQIDPMKRIYIFKEHIAIVKNSEDFENLFKDLGTVTRNKQEVTITLNLDNETIKEAFKGMPNVSIQDNKITIEKVSTVSPGRVCDSLYKQLNNTQDLSDDWKSKPIDEKISSIKTILPSAPTNTLNH